MNLRRSIRFSVSAIVWLLSLTSIGVVLWVADEGFGWDLFPDWLENCATVLLASVGLLTAFAVVSCLSSSAALAALAVADRAGMEPDRAPSKVRRWAVRGVFAAIALAVATGVVLQKVDAWCKIWENLDARKRREPRLNRAPLVDLPSVWERDTVRALFDGAELEVPFMTWSDNAQGKGLCNAASILGFARRTAIW